jgi:hypothetical protein
MTAGKGRKRVARVGVFAYWSALYFFGIHVFRLNAKIGPEIGYNKDVH